MTVYCLGNPLHKPDSLPLMMMGSLVRVFPQISFIEIDPTENFIPVPGSLILDTVMGIRKLTLFSSPDDFLKHKLISVHDYDLYFHLQLLIKLRKIKSVKILGITAKTKLSDIVSILQRF